MASQRTSAQYEGLLLLIIPSLTPSFQRCSLWDPRSKCKLITLKYWALVRDPRITLFIQINRYPTDKCTPTITFYPLYSDLSAGQVLSTLWEQLGAEKL